jgi:hypothetical protein
MGCFTDSSGDVWCSGDGGDGYGGETVSETFIYVINEFINLGAATDAQLSTLQDYLTGFDAQQLALDGILVNSLFGDTLGSIFQTLTSWVQWLWQNVVNVVIAKLYDLVQRILAWLQRLLAPLIDFLKKLKAQLDWYFQTFIKPIFDFLQRLRRILAVFRLLGFKWAAKLDQDIAHIESQLAKNFLLAEQAINTALNWINFITDPLGLYNPVLFALSAIASIGDLFNALWQSQTFGLPAYPTTDQQQTAAKYTQPVALAQVRQMAISGVLPDDQARIGQLNSVLTGLGYPSTIGA